ncbi:MAG TPA: hypothetical protein VFD58_08040 [Blastocatellia bacterium]|nr:hypothetical protein [Blastocatellia bacterium]
MSRFTCVFRADGRTGMVRGMTAGMGRLRNLPGVMLVLTMANDAGPGLLRE